MRVNVLIKKNSYFDSVSLMNISNQIAIIEGVENASVCMGTELNQELLRDSGLSNEKTENATANDLIIVFAAESEPVIVHVFQMIEQFFSKKNENSRLEVGRPFSLHTALHEVPDANLAVISIPGEFAVLEAKKALLKDLNVMLFSDNISIEDEKMLKELAHKKGQLMMGPDCGTAIINQKGICFANAVREGGIGIVAASGTGAQEVSVLIHKYGEGISQLIGTGGRDLSETVGGIMMIDALKALNRDEKTKVIVLVSKQPHPSISEKLISESEKCSKPVVICFLHSKQGGYVKNPLYFENTLESAARRAVYLLNQSEIHPVEELEISVAREVWEGLAKSQKYVRGLFCGGTLCEEAFQIFKSECKEGKVYSNISKVNHEKLKDPFKSLGHTFIDLGDDLFTVSKPHPMIDHSNRLARILEEAKDKEVAVMLLDFVLGYGSHDDPVGTTLPAIIKAQELAKENNRNLIFVAYICGTDLDRQGLDEQEEKLRDIGVLLAKSNVHAAKLTVEIMKGVTYAAH